MERNLTMMTDLYQLTMMYGYFRKGMGENRAVFDLFYRRAGDEIAHAVAAGLEQAVDYVRGLHFSEEDLAYLRSLRMFDEDFLDYLRQLRFTGDINAVPEGTPVFPKEPMVVVRAPAIEAQLLETFDGRFDHVDAIVGAVALGADILHARKLQHGTSRAAGDYAGALGSRHQHNLTGAEEADRLVRDRSADQRHGHEMFLCVFRALADGFGNFRSLADANADATLFVADDHQRSEAEVTSTLDNLGNTVDGNELLFEFADLFHALHAFVLLT